MGRYTTTTNTTTSKRNTNTRLLLALAGSIFRLSFASHDIHRRTHTKRTENFTCIHNILCCRTENAQSNTVVKKRRKCFGWHSHGWIGLVYVVVMLDHKHRFCCLCPKRDIFRAFVFTKGFSFCHWLPIAGQVHQPSIVQAIQPV